MRHLTVSAAVQAPGPYTIAYIATYFAGPTYCDASGKPASVRFSIPALGGATVEKSVMVILKVQPYRDHVVNITWDPINTAIFPHFEGSFRVESTEQSTCTLILDGEYTAPGAATGALFDAIAGGYIARVTMEDLVHRVGHAAENEFQVRNSL